MIEETPRSFETRGRSDGRFRRQWRQMQEAYHGAGPQAKRSPKEPSAVPGTVISVSQVGFDQSGIITPPIGPEATARLRPARSWKAEGPTRPFGGAGRPMPFAQALSNQQNHTATEVRDMKHAAVENEPPSMTKHLVNATHFLGRFSPWVLAGVILALMLAGEGA